MDLTVAGKNKTESQKLQHKQKLVEFCVSVGDFVILFLSLCLCGRFCDFVLFLLHGHCNGQLTDNSSN